MDTIVEVPVTSLYQGVSRQPPTTRAINQLQDLVNCYPSVDLMGSPRRPPTRTLFNLQRNLYEAGPYHFFRTTDGQRWIALRRVSSGVLDVFNLDSGAVATITASPQAQAYLALPTARLKYLQVADTTLILNPAATVAATTPAKPPMTRIYVWVRRVSSAAQTYRVTSPSYGGAEFSLAANNSTSRDTVAQTLAARLNTALGASGVSAAILATNTGLIRIDGPDWLLSTLQSDNTWDPTALTSLKGRVTTTSDLPYVCDDGAVLAVDEVQGDVAGIYYVRFDAATASWVETSYLPGAAPTCTLDGATMPVRLRQTGYTSFTLEVCPWVARTKGDENSNPAPFFVGAQIADFAVWKGRLIFACADTLTMSQPDDLFNLWKETGRESRPADTIELPANSDNLAVIQHIVPFRSVLFVTGNNVQLEVPGDQPLTPANASINVTTRYVLNPDCRPVVVGDAIHYAGISEGRGAVWQYFYDLQSQSNSAFDLAKHIPDYIQGLVLKIAGAGQSSRLWVRSASAPNTLFSYTSYWNGGQRVQSAWSRGIVLATTDVIQDFEVIDAALYLAVERAGVLSILSAPVDAQLLHRTAAVNLPLPYLDKLFQVTPSFNALEGKSSVVLPSGLDGGDLVICGAAAQDAWWREWSGAISGSSVLIEGDITGLAEYWIGERATASLTFSPFYTRDAQTNMPNTNGRFQVHQVGLNFDTSGQFTSTVTKRSGVVKTVQRGPRLVGGQLTAPLSPDGYDTKVPFNTEGNQASLMLSCDSTTPWNLTQATLFGRYTDPLNNT